jgi:O-antigen ligase
LQKEFEMEQVLNAPQVRSWGTAVRLKKLDPTRWTFFWLTAFYIVYCARPEDYIPGLYYIPLAKITAAFTLMAIISASGRTKRTFRDIPLEGKYLAALIGWYFLSAIFSPIWKGGALSRSMDFSKVLVVYALTFLLITDFGKLRRIIFIQAASVPVICAVSIIKGHSMPRLAGVIGGIYSNPNDLAFAIVLTLPFCLAFLLTAKGAFRKVVWFVSMLIMGLALLMTASRAGILTLAVSGTVALWHFGVKGRRLYLIVATFLIGILLLAVAGGPLMDRIAAINGNVSTKEEQLAYSSYEARRYLMGRAFDGMVDYPLFGVGARNFAEYSLIWEEVHNSYLQIAVEGGIPAGILYLLFFARGFKNLKRLRRLKDLDLHTTLFVGGLHASLVGFFVGAFFAPEAYQFFPYFGVAYTSALVAIVAEQRVGGQTPGRDEPKQHYRFGEVYGRSRKSNALAPIR